MTAAGFSLAGVGGGGGWDELVMQDASGDFHDINPPIFGVPFGMTTYPVTGAVTCGGLIAGGRGNGFKVLVWEDGGGDKGRAGGAPVPVLPGGCVAMGGVGALTPLPGAPALAGAEAPGAIERLARMLHPAIEALSFSSQAIAAAPAENISVTAPAPAPALPGWGFPLLTTMMLVAVWYGVRRLRGAL